jgi:hypothetical protein
MMTTAERVARNIEARHGRAALRQLLDDLANPDVTYKVAGARLGVSPQRVGQWANVLVQRVEICIVSDDVRRVLDPC